MPVWIVMLLFMALPAQADIYQCNTGGTPTFQDTPCDTQSEPLDLTRAISNMGSPPPNSGGKDAHSRAEEAGDAVRRIRQENADPKKCKAAKTKLEAMKINDPIGYKLDVSSFEYSQAISLYCGN